MRWRTAAHGERRVVRPTPQNPIQIDDGIVVQCADAHRFAELSAEHLDEGPRRVRQLGAPQDGLAEVEQLERQLVRQVWRLTDESALLERVEQAKSRVLRA